MRQTRRIAFVVIGVVLALVFSPIVSLLLHNDFAGVLLMVALGAALGILADDHIGGRL